HGCRFTLALRGCVLSRLRTARASTPAAPRGQPVASSRSPAGRVGTPTASGSTSFHQRRCARTALIRWSRWLRPCATSDRSGRGTCPWPSASGRSLRRCSASRFPLEGGFDRVPIPGPPQRPIRSRRNERVPPLPLLRGELPRGCLQLAEQNPVAFHEHEVRPAFPVSLDGCAPVAALVHGGPERRCPPPGHAGQADDLRLEVMLLHLRLVLFGFDGPAGRLRGFVACQHAHA